MDNLIVKKLLVPVDYSQTSLNALDLAVAMGQRHSAEIRLLHVLKSSPDDYSRQDGTAPEELATSPLEKEILRLQQLAERIAATQAVHCSVECRTGLVCDQIVEAAAEYNADLIVIGTHGTSDIRSYLTGMEAYRVIRASSCPVLTVPNHQKWIDFREIIFPIRPVQGIADKYSLARLISRKNNAHLTVLGLLDRYDPLKNEILTNVLTSLTNQLSQDEINGDTLLLETDSVPYTIYQKANELQADLIIVTADIDSASKFSLFGPLVEQLINHAKVPVLSIRPQSVAAPQRPPVASQRSQPSLA